jgi:asparagine synthase (glutamine-hydrolysing)
VSTPISSLHAPAGCVIGGFVAAPSRGEVGADTLRAMASRLTRAPGTICSGVEPAGLFGAGAGSTVEEGDEAWVVADMDLVNIKELRASAGSRAPGHGLLTALYRLEGPRFVRRLRGAFALALWDRRRRQLLLAVDHFGMRRLHYVAERCDITFASRLGALLAAPGITPSVDPRAVYSYLNFGFVPAPETPFEGIRRLPPGHLLLAREGYCRLEPFWDMAYREVLTPEEEAASRLLQSTHQAVSDALSDIASRDVGAFLSGGTDSSTVVGLMTGITGERVSAFSIGFREHRYDELRYAELAARHFGAVHHTRIVTPEDALAVLPRLVEVYDEPFGNNSAVGTFFCAQLARECGARQLLAGDGGDEIFGGNERYRTDRIFARYGRLPAILRRGLLEPVLLRLPDGSPGPLGRAQRYIRRAKIPNPRRFYSYEFYVAQNAHELLAPDFLRATDVDAPWRVVDEHFRRADDAVELNRLLYLDLKLTIGDNDLLKVARTAELAGVGVRFPLLDLPLVEFTGTLPADFKVRGLEKRYLFKRAFRTLLPRETLTKRKHGFGVPTADWLRRHSGFGELARDTLLSSRARGRGYFRPRAIENLLALHAADSTAFYGDILWTLLMLELWHCRHADRGAGR